MYKNQKVVVVMPAYNAEKTLKATYNEIPHNIVDEIILVDDKSSDKTVIIAKELGIREIIVHEENKGYGGNQKTCYMRALELNADVIIMLHPDYQYTPGLIEAMVSIIANKVYPIVFGSRILGRGALTGGMPLYKYIANRMLTLIQNILSGEKLSEYHTGYRAYSSEVLRNIHFNLCSDDFIFDNEVIAQLFWNRYQIAEVTCPTKYFEGASSINFNKSVVYGLGVLRVSFLYLLSRIGIYKWSILGGKRKKLRKT